MTFPAPVRPYRSEPEPPIGGLMKSVLVVEDDESNRALVAKYLKREGYKVLFAQDGLRGVELAQAEAPDLILMDLELPELNG
jgi:CheY-like chemotaxis protein